MAEQAHPPRRSRTRRVFLWIVALTVVAMGAALHGGPFLVASDEADPRPYMAFLPLLTATALLLGVGWLVWMSRRGGKRGD